MYSSEKYLEDRAFEEFEVPENSQINLVVVIPVTLLAIVIFVSCATILSSLFCEDRKSSQERLDAANIEGKLYSIHK